MEIVEEAEVCKIDKNTACMGLRAYHKISERFEVSERLCTYVEK